MSKTQKQGLPFYRSENLAKAGADNYFLTRLSGESTGPFAELNLSFRVGDDPGLVKKNYQKVKQALGLHILATVQQVHGSRVLDLDLEQLDEDHLRGIEADAIVTSKKGAAVGVLVADCFPLILFEKKKKILAVAHCGWRGIVGSVIENALQAIAEKGGESKEVLAAVGPGVCANCYQVDDVVIAEFKKRFPQGEGKIWVRQNNGYQLDLKAAIFSVLNGQDVGQGRTEDLGLCTCCNDEFFSHRRDQGRTGRQLALAML